MKKPAVARGVVVIQNATPIEPEPGTVPVTEDDDKVLVEIRVSRFFVYGGEAVNKAVRSHKRKPRPKAVPV